MLKRFKKFFLPLFNKKIFLAFFGLIIIGALLFPQPASAAWWDWIVGAINFIPSAFINLLAQGIILITGVFVTLAGGILKWVLSGSFTTLSYTNPANNPIIAAGLNITQSFVNMALVLVLIFIAFSTILRLAGYETKRLLITLIVVALLVNFAPVICGLIVDACNIAMHFFTDHITGLTNLANMAQGCGDRIIAGFTSIKFTEQIGVLAESFVLIIFNSLLIFILLIFALIFMVRYIAIWTAVILAPLAFVSYILPATRNIWNIWWNQFIQWSIIGVVMGFFLYLGEQVSELVSITGEYAIIGREGITALTTHPGVFDQVLPHMVTLAFLYLGLIYGFQTNALLATNIISTGKRGGRTVRKWAGKEAWRRAEEKAKIPSAAERVGRWAATKPVLGTLVGLPLKGYAERYRGGFEEGEKKYEKWKSEDIAAALDRLPELHKAAGLKIIAERGHFDLAEKAGYGISDERRREILRTAERYGKERDILKFMPQYAGEVASARAEAARKGITPIEAAVRWQKPADVEKLDRSVFDIEAVRRAMVYQYGPENWGRLYHQGPEIINMMQETLEREFRERPDELIRRNYPLLRYTHSAAGQAYWRPIGKLEDIEAARMLQRRSIEEIERELADRRAELERTVRAGEPAEEIARRIRELEEERTKRGGRR